MEYVKKIGHGQQPGIEPDPVRLPAASSDQL